MSENKTCYECKCIGFDSCALGYCNNSTCIHYRCIVLDDSGCKVKNCDDFEPKEEEDVII